MAHTWKHKQEQKSQAQYPRTKKLITSKKRGKGKHAQVEYSIDLGELADAGYDVEGLFKGTSLAEIEKRLSKKKF
jgi:hypothetical protein